MTNNRTIFLVDDDRIFLEMLRDTLLTEQQLNVIAFQTGEDCLLNLHLAPDIIVLDYLLNSKIKEAKNGLEIIKQINEQTPNTKVVVLTAHEDIDLVYKFTLEDATNYILKDNDVFINIKHAIEEAIQ